MKFDVSDKAKSLDHVLRHFPPQLRCGQKGCTFATHDTWYLQIHQSSRHQIHNFPSGKKFYPCGMCDKKIPTPKELERHVNEHENETAKCSKCGKWYAAYYIKCHETAFCQFRDEGYFNHQCLKCTRKLETYDGLKSHLRSVRDQREVIVSYVLAASGANMASTEALDTSTKYNSLPAAWATIMDGISKSSHPQGNAEVLASQTEFSLAFNTNGGRSKKRSYDQVDEEE